MAYYFHAHTERGGIGMRTNCDNPNCDCNAGETEGLAAARELLAAARTKGSEPTRAEVLAALDLACGGGGGGGGGGEDVALAAMMAGTRPEQRERDERAARNHYDDARRQFVANAVMRAMPEDKIAEGMIPVSFADALKARDGKKDNANFDKEDTEAAGMVPPTFAQALAARDGRAAR